MNRNEPATKGDLQDLESRLKSHVEGKIDAVEQRMRDYMVETIRDSETRLLQAFYGFADTANKRMTQTDLTVALVIGRVTTVESRLLEVEKRLNMPPAA